ncbi:hypothetical protein [Ancylobacter pratisalsi]|uniref:Glycine-rich domain-containing protein n=1 Tax=Ancylobacter pratisalsi TaxID=1745854 RepID=A0A6P1YMS9_9HYPH|nr:hypothetical protein [Ancylobacter pratisalsi]QIB34737.1 hypothetical protein G3A50_14255 [Ancylobacter pratisalsi]
MDRVNGEDWVDIGGGKRGFRGQNDVAGLPGTEIASAWLNGVQEEILTPIEKSGGVAAAGANDLLAKAIRSHGLNLVVAGGTADAITGTLSIPITSYTEILNAPILIKLGAATNTGPGTINLGPGVEPCTRMDGTPLRPGDWSANGLITVAHDGAAFRLLGVSNSSAPRRVSTSFSTPGVYSYTVGQGVYALDLQLWGGGGGGGGAGSNGPPTAAPGAGSGGYKRKRVDVTPGQVLAVIVGAPGAGGIAGGGSGQSGGSSSVGALLTVAGGSGGTGAVDGYSGAAGVGGAATGADINRPGRYGQGPIAADVPIGGMGGAAFAGAPSGPNTAAGQEGVFPGGGGSGGTGDLAGGSGASGWVIITPD